jgi:stage II sporulation protein R
MGVLTMYRGKVVIFLLAITIPFLFTSSTYPDLRADQSCIRFHVIANSDSAEDQAVKLMVRDRLLAEYGTKLGQANSLEGSRHIIEKSLKDIEASAQEEVDKHLPGHRVRASLGRFDFPTRAYGDMLLPAGNYEALRITIGEGKGANWWCVMFPPLCFVDISHGIADGDSHMEEEMVDSESGDETQVVYKLKIVEWWEKAKEIFNP